jgi:hypothetical protein
MCETIYLQEVKGTPPKMKELEGEDDRKKPAEDHDEDA